MMRRWNLGSEDDFDTQVDPGDTGPLRQLFPKGQTEDVTGGSAEPQPFLTPGRRDMLRNALLALSTFGGGPASKVGMEMVRQDREERRLTAAETRQRATQEATERRQRQAKDTETENLRSSSENVSRFRQAEEEGSIMAGPLLRHAQRTVTNPVVAKELLDINSRRAKRGREATATEELRGLVQKAVSLKARGEEIDDTLLGDISIASERAGRNPSVTNHLLDYLVGGKTRVVGNEAITEGLRGNIIKRWPLEEKPEKQAKFSAGTLAQIGLKGGVVLDPRVIDPATLERYHPGLSTKWQQSLVADEEAKHLRIRAEKLADAKAQGADILNRQTAMLAKRDASKHASLLEQRSHGFAGAYKLLDQVEELISAMEKKGFLAKGPSSLSALSALAKRSEWSPIGKPGDADLATWMSHSGTMVAIQRQLGDIGPRAIAAYEGAMKLISHPTTAAGARKAFGQLREALQAVQGSMAGKSWTPWPGTDVTPPASSLGMLQPGGTREELPDVPLMR